MQYISTRGGEPVSAAQAIVRGISPNGGLYVPESFVRMDVEDLLPYAEDYPALAARVLAPYLDMEAEELLPFTRLAYQRFDTQAVAPLHSLTKSESVLELFHGPTLAFKDMALQMLPYLMRMSLERTGEEKKLYILVATSGDTGKAALEGFRDVPGTMVQVFYPDGGVSRAQFLQMATQEGGNMHVCGVKGNFDDAQTAVKRIFANTALNKAVSEKGYRLSSANSINFGRLLPQIAYYYAAYARLVKSGRIKNGECVNFCVPTGNFGNILAGYYAMRMGLPVRKFICASNRNNVLTDFFQKGRYDMRRPFYKSMSCSIDILVSSNLERLIFEFSDRDEKKVEGYMRALSEEGGYTLDKEVHARIQALFHADYCDEETTLYTIKRCFDENAYLMDPHTAVAQTVYERYAQSLAGHTVLLATAHPFKFASDVLRAFETPLEDDFENANRLAVRANMLVPEAFAALKQKTVLHKSVVEIADMQARVLGVLH